MMTTLHRDNDPGIAADDLHIAHMCKALSSTVRIQIVRYVLAHPGCIGNDILLHLPENCPHAQSTLSRHLRVLRESRVLDAEADGPAVCYRVNHQCLEWLSNQLHQM
jgi:predicted transcriptional regulator